MPLVLRSGVFRRLALAVLALESVACRPSDILRVPPPAGETSNSALRNQSGAESEFTGGRASLFAALAEGSFDPPALLLWAGLLTDEFTFGGFSLQGHFANVDARITAAYGPYAEAGDLAWNALVTAHSTLGLALPNLAQYAPASLGEDYALIGYSELFFAEDYCAGTTLDELVPGGGIQVGVPLTTDSLFGLAEAHFDSAVAEAHGNDTTLYLASVGLGRTLLGRGQYQAAAAAAQNVPPSFVYNTQLAPSLNTGAAYPNFYSYGTSAGGAGFFAPYDQIFTVADREGGNGLNFESAFDPRLLLDTTTYTTGDGTPWRIPVKFEIDPVDIPLATGIEAQLIVAEALLQQGNVTGWLNDLNALRNSGCTVSGSDTTCTVGTGQVTGQAAGLPALSDPGTDSGRVSVLFRERAFWLFGTGTRLGDLRRLIRQYGRPADAVFPTGTYVGDGDTFYLQSPIPTYGTDVSLTLPTAASGAAPPNPHYKGCITSTKTA